MRSAFPAAEWQSLLRGLAQRWGDQREGQNEQQQGYKTPAHVWVLWRQRGVTSGTNPALGAEQDRRHPGLSRKTGMRLL